MIGSQISVRVLGPVSLGPIDETVALGGALPRGFLAIVALESPRPVAVDRLSFLLWGDDAPNGVKVALQQIASRVRRALTVAGIGDALHAVAPGYALDVDPSTIDVRVFRSAVRAANESHRQGDDIDAIAGLTAALELWSGPPLADLADQPLATLLVPALEDERWRAEERRAEILLATGRSAECAELLSAATGRAPLRERLWVLQAQALAAAGRPADAVRCARAGIAVITAELGVPPGPELASIEQNVRANAAAQPIDERVHAAPLPELRPSLLDGALRRALDNAERAAGAATQRLAHDEAVRQWQRAVELLDTIDPGDDRTRLRLLLGLGEAHNTVSLEADARRVFARSMDIARRLGDGPGFAWSALGYCADRTGFSSPAEQQVLLREALNGLAEHDVLLRGRVLARLATECYWHDSADVTLELAEAALEASTEAGDSEGRLLARYAILFGCWTPDRTPRLVAECEAYLDEALAAGDHRHQLLAHRWLVPAVTELGDVARGMHSARVAVEMADELGLSVQQWISRVIAATQLLVVGRLEEAESLASEALSLGSVSEPETAFDYVSLFMWTLHWLRGRLGDIVELVEQVATAPGVDLARRLGLALTYAELGRPEATTILDSITTADLRRVPRDASWYIVMAAMAEAAALTRHQRAARDVLEQLRPFHERIAVNSVSASGPVAHHIGIAAWTVGQHDLGMRALTDAVDIADRVGAPMFAARSRIALAECHAAMGRHDRARPLAEAALAVARANGLTGVERSAVALLGSSTDPVSEAVSESATPARTSPAVD